MILLRIAMVLKLLFKLNLLLLPKFAICEYGGG